MKSPRGIEFEFRDQTNSPMRGTSLYLLPYLPIVDCDLNSYFLDKDLEALIDQSNLDDPKALSLVEAFILFETRGKEYLDFELGFLGMIQEMGYQIAVRNYEYQLEASPRSQGDMH